MNDLSNLNKKVSALYVAEEVNRLKCICEGIRGYFQRQSNTKKAIDWFAYNDGGNNLFHSSTIYDYCATDCFKTIPLLVIQFTLEGHLTIKFIVEEGERVIIDVSNGKSSFLQRTSYLASMRTALYNAMSLIDGTFEIFLEKGVEGVATEMGCDSKYEGEMSIEKFLSIFIEKGIWEFCEED